MLMAAYRKQKSVLYKWQNESLIPVQNITASKPTSWTSFQIGNKVMSHITSSTTGSRSGGWARGGGGGGRGWGWGEGGQQHKKEHGRRI